MRCECQAVASHLDGIFNIPQKLRFLPKKKKRGRKSKEQKGEEAAAAEAADQFTLQWGHGAGNPHEGVGELSEGDEEKEWDSGCPRFGTKCAVSFAGNPDSRVPNHIWQGTIVSAYRRKSDLQLIYKVWFGADLDHQELTEEVLVNFAIPLNEQTWPHGAVQVLN